MSKDTKDQIVRGSMGQRQSDLEPLQFTLTWEELCLFWQHHAGTSRHPDTKTASPFISPFLMRAGAVGKERSNIVGYSCWFGADIDIGGWTLDGLAALFDGIPYFLHTTTNHRPASPRLRSILLLSRDLTDESEYLRLWHFINTLVDGCVDVKTKNWNRLLYVPAQWSGAANEYRFVLHGTPLDVDQVLCWSPPIEMIASPEPCETMPGAGKCDFDDLITPHMEDAFRKSAEGGRFYSLMIRMALRAKWLDWKLSAADLLTKALEFDGIETGKARPNSLGEARHALSYAAAHGDVAENNESEIAGSALVWAHDHATLRASPYSLYHRTLYDSTLVRFETLKSAIDRGTVGRSLKTFAGKVAGRACANGYPLTVEELTKILKEFREVLS